MEEPGECVMEVELAITRLDIDTSRRADQLVEMVLVMMFRDASTREPLLRYARLGRVPTPEPEITHDAQLRRGLDELVQRMNMTGSLRPANLADDQIRPGCRGTLAARGRGETKARSR